MQKAWSAQFNSEWQSFRLGRRRRPFCFRPLDALNSHRRQSARSGGGRQKSRHFLDEKAGVWYCFSEINKAKLALLISAADRGFGAQR